MTSISKQPVCILCAAHHPVISVCLIYIFQFLITNHCLLLLIIIVHVYCLMLPIFLLAWLLMFSSCVLYTWPVSDLDQVSCCSSPGASSERPIFMSQNSISSPSLNVIGDSMQWVERKRHHRRVSSGDKVKLTQISSDFKHEIDQKSKRGLILTIKPLF